MITIEEWPEKKIKESCSFTELINRLYADFQSDSSKIKFSFQNKVHNIEEFTNWANSFRECLEKLLCIDDLLKQRDPSKIEIVKGNSELEFSTNKFRVQHFYIKSWMDTLIPVFLCIPNNLPKSIKVPAVICTHGHTMQKLNLIGKKFNFIYQGTWAKDFAELGCITIAMDQFGWGERGTRLWKLHSTKTQNGWNYDNNEKKYALNLLIFGRILNGIRYFEVIKQVDYLLTHENVDPNRIGVAGLSLGASSAIYSAALDPRISFIIANGYLNSFKGSILDIWHCPDNYIPNILKSCELYDIASLIAPRPALYIMGKKDHIFPIETAKSSFDRVQSAYKLFNKIQNCRLEIHNGGHKWKKKVAVHFIQDILNNKITI